ncbi:MAG: hypothetical protein LBF51_02770 [Zoogloeaceae bacterium]|jgi:hypothetical protein|nr:hypothetical protein [Zoogloeaceae bacterium]
MFSSFGFSPVDTCALGYQARVLPLLAGGLALFAWFLGARILTVALLLGMIGWRLHWLDTDYRVSNPSSVSRSRIASPMLRVMRKRIACSRPISL